MFTKYLTKTINFIKKVLPYLELFKLLYDAGFQKDKLVSIAKEQKITIDKEIVDKEIKSKGLKDSFKSLLERVGTYFILKTGVENPENSTPPMAIKDRTAKLSKMRILPKTMKKLESKLELEPLGNFKNIKG